MPNFWPPTPKRNYLTVFLTVKIFQRFQRQEIPSLIWRIAKYAGNKGIVDIAHRGASGFVEFFTNGPQPSGANVS
jgi:hypothetical protein